MGICSKIADDFYNHTEYKEGSGSHLVVSEIEKPCKKSETKITVEGLTFLVRKTYPARKGIEKKILPVVY